MTTTCTAPAPSASSIVAGCPTCDLGLHHCHALVATHDDGSWTCLDGCPDPLAVHDDVVPCAELGLGCCAAAGAAVAVAGAAAPDEEEHAWAA